MLLVVKSEKMPTGLSERQAVEWHLDRAFKADNALIVILYEATHGDGKKSLMGCSIPRPKKPANDFVFAVRVKVSDLLNLVLPEALLDSALQKAFERGE